MRSRRWIAAINTSGIAREFEKLGHFRRAVPGSGAFPAATLGKSTTSCKLDGLINWILALTVESSVYFKKEMIISFHNGILLRDDRVIIPDSLCLKLLQRLHSSHLSTVKTKQYAHAHVWWPKMDKYIEDIIQRCHTCALVAPKLQSDFQPWPEPDLPWQRVHIDFAGPFWGEKWLLIIDAKTKFTFAEAMGTETTAQNTIQVLERIFDFCGPCTAIVSDNGPPFNSQDMTVF
uniref:RNA-directed DNA polymerase n=1 Tax=Plectus sambesii TaxID=2011161 RepID=A0A914WGN0_9BILA